MITRTPLPDDDERLEVTDRDGIGSGQFKRRADVHRAGDWHRTRTVWAVLPNHPGGPALLLQQRGLLKDAWPGLLDASSAGHIGPDDSDRWREVEEELGARPADGDVLRLGLRRVESRQAGVRIDREVQELWLWLCPRALAEFRPPAPEVTALVAAPLTGLSDLIAGRVVYLACAVRWAADDADRDARAPVELRREDLIPDSLGYVAQVATLAARALAGERDLLYDPARERA
ncbi:MAG: hypothetical protein FJ029_11145 [Actinobacteria bacterium]|nr:hypothetical protein [Actinomycetota bacterium]